MPISSDLWLIILDYFTPQELLMLSLVNKNWLLHTEFKFEEKGLILNSDTFNNFKSAESLTSKKSFFSVEKQIFSQTKELIQELSNEERFLVAYHTYPDQIPLKPIIGEEAKLAQLVIKCIAKNPKVNLSNNYGITLLHNLLWFNRIDLARFVIMSEHFTKINYKFHIPYTSSTMHASALDFAIGLWLFEEEATALELDFIKLLLSYGATPPNVNAKFMNSNLATVICPILFMNKPCKRSKQDLIDLFVLLNRYDFSIEQLEQHLHTTLFEHELYKNVEENFSLSKEVQQEKVNNFINELKLTIQNDKERREIVIEEMTEERLDDGALTLHLTFDPHGSACCIM